MQVQDEVQKTNDLRDQFAMQAMKTALNAVHISNEIYNIEDIAECAYKMADAMIKARG